jgi:hypothetical protein
VVTALDPNFSVGIVKHRRALGLGADYLNAGGDTYLLGLRFG